MVNKKKCKKKNYKSSQINTIILIGIILFAIFGFKQGWFEKTTIVSDQTIIQRLDSPNSDKECIITSDKSAYCTGEFASVDLKDGINTQCTVFMNKDNSAWSIWGTVTTNNLGLAKRYGQLNDIGNYKIRVLCDGCLSNRLDIDVITCPGSEPDPENCWWQEIDSISTFIDPFYRIEWKNSLPSGDFKWSWSSSDILDTEIIKDMTGVQFFNDKSSGNYEFSSTGNNWGVAMTNSFWFSVNTDIKLYQWICEGDPLNFDPHMFDSPYSKQYQPNENSDCYDECTHEGYTTGYLMGIQGCYDGGQLLQGTNCCCLGDI